MDAGICEPPSSISSYTHLDYFENPEFDDFPVIMLIGIKPIDIARYGQTKSYQPKLNGKKLHVAQMLVFILGEMIHQITICLITI